MFDDFSGRHDGGPAGRPLVVHEQNSVAGLANRVLAGVADKVVTGFPNVLAKGEWAAIRFAPRLPPLSVQADRFEGRSGPLRLLVVGGKPRYKVLNDTVLAALALIAED